VPTDLRRIMITTTDSLARSLRVLGLSPDADKEAGVPAAGSQQIIGAMARYADAIGHAGRELDRILTRPEWNMIADLMNGCADLWDYSESPIGAMHMIVANIEDGQRLDGAGDKWLADELRPRSGDKKTAELVEKLRRLSPIHGDAIVAAVRYFWSHSPDVDHVEDRWWTVEFRTKPRAKKLMR